MIGWVDRTTFDAAIREDSQSVRLMHEMFQELHPKLQDELDAAISSNDLAGVRELAHILKSRLRLLHCSRLGDAAESLEHRAAQGYEAGMADDFQRLKGWIVEAVEELRRLLEESPS